MQVFYNLLTRDALLIHDEQAHSLSGPFASKEDAEEAASELVGRLEGQNYTSEVAPPEPQLNEAVTQAASLNLPNKAVTISTRGQDWVVQIIEDETTSELEFGVEEHANSYAAGQRIRLGLQTECGDQATELSSNTAKPFNVG